MSSKVIIPLPTAAPFQNVVPGNLERKPKEVKRTISGLKNAQNTTDASVIASSNELSSYNVSCKDSVTRVDELEKTIKFLKDEQKRMLNNLHQEIASLQAKNRDLLCQLIFNAENTLDYRNSMNDTDIKILMAIESSKKPKSATTENREKKDYVCKNCRDPSGVKEIQELKFTIDQQQREIEHLRGQLELVGARNKNQTRENRRVDNYIREIEDRNQDQEHVIRLLRNEIKDHKIEVENLRKAISGMRMPGHIPHGVQITHVPPQAQLFPTVGTPSTYWYQNKSIPISEYHQLQCTNMNGAGEDHHVATNGVQFTLPPVCNYRQMAAPLPPPPLFYSTATVSASATGCYYSVAPRPMLRSKSYISPAHSETGHGLGTEAVQQRSLKTNNSNTRV